MSPAGALDPRLGKLERHFEHSTFGRGGTVRQAEAFELVEGECLDFAACS